MYEHRTRYPFEEPEQNDILRAGFIPVGSGYVTRGDFLVKTCRDRTPGSSPGDSTECHIPDGYFDSMVVLRTYSGDCRVGVGSLYHRELRQIEVWDHCSADFLLLPPGNTYVTQGEVQGLFSQHRP